MDSNSAREIEVELNLERGWMDQPIVEGAAVTWPFQQIQIDEVVALSDEDKGYLQRVIRATLVEAGQSKQASNLAHSGNATGRHTTPPKSATG